MSRSSPPLGRGSPRRLAHVLFAGRTALAGAGVLDYGALFLARGEPRLLLCALSDLACATFAQTRRPAAARPAR